ncbi:pyrimidine reductase [Streptomyces sp. Act143]|uniref:dihydrofolate reductase family protein n=1 Tax=Streptomyces sp. Act143 TaxID=2200760 RepID=UPI000D673F98|nr:dihydrofolate reductase family protein [Streptomyces sp. Act143]PWI13020.1 pyrimidine reductase [Streptomyces sp. Act143]
MTQRRIVAGLFISADGVVGAPEQWTFQHMTEEAGAIIGGLVAEADTMLLGRTTYEEFAGYWSQQTGPMADAFNGMRKLVASHSLTVAEWNNSEILGGDLIEQLNELKNAPGRNINTSGSISVVRTLLEAGLLDDLHLMVFPIVLGGGTRLFPDHGKRLDMTLAGTHTFDTGVVHLHYRLDTPAR